MFRFLLCLSFMMPRVEASCLENAVPAAQRKAWICGFVDDLAYFLKKSTTNGASIFFFGGISLSRTCFSGPDERQR